MVMNEAGAMVQETEYFPFGLEIDRNNPAQTTAQRNAVNKYNFLGKETQIATGYIDLQARFYDPAIGRFMAMDPETEGQLEFSPYHYSFNNPIRFSDPDGRFPECCGEWGAAAGGFAQGFGQAVVRNVKALTIDLPRTVQGLASMPTVSGQLEAVVGSTMLYEKTKSDWNSGDVGTRANIVGNVVGEVAVAVAGSKGAGSLGKAGSASEIVSLDAKLIRFSQSSVNGVGKIEASMAKSGWQGAAVDVVKISDGNLTTLDNTRVLASSRTGTPVKANVLSHNSPIPASMAERFPNKKGVLPSTYGQAIENRIQNQSSAFRKQYSQGSNIISSNQ